MLQLLMTPAIATHLQGCDWPAAACCCPLLTADVSHARVASFPVCNVADVSVVAFPVSLPQVVRLLQEQE